MCSRAFSDLWYLRGRGRSVLGSTQDNLRILRVSAIFSLSSLLPIYMHCNTHSHSTLFWSIIFASGLSPNPYMNFKKTYCISLIKGKNKGEEFVSGIFNCLQSYDISIQITAKDCNQSDIIGSKIRSDQSAPQWRLGKMEQQILRPYFISEILSRYRISSQSIALLPTLL